MGSARLRSFKAAGLAMVVAVPVLLLGACSSDEETLTVYSGRTENLVGPILDQFTQDTGIEVDVRYGNTADLALQVETEGEQTPADVFISQSPGAMGFLASNGDLASLSTETVAAVPKQYRDSQNRWVGMSGRVRTLVYNTEQVEQSDLPKSIDDLTTDKYRGKVALAPANGSFQDFVTAMRADRGDEQTEQWLQAMADNDAATYADNTSIVQAVGRGEVPMGLVNHYYNERAKVEDPGVPSENHFFADGDVGSVLLTTAAGVLEASDNKQNAERLVAFLLDDYAQEFFSNETFEYPLAKDAAVPQNLPELDSITASSVDFDGLGDGFRETLEMINDSGLSSP